MPLGPPRRRRARPVADAPIDELLARSEDLAKGWLLALVEQAPLGEAPTILAADLSRDGPPACDAVVRALADDGDLRRLEPGGSLEPLIGQTAVSAAGRDIAPILGAVDALHGVIWSGVRAELRDADSELVAGLAERLVLVVELVRRAAVRASMASGVQIAREAAGESSAGGGERAEGPEALWRGALGDEIRRAELSGGTLSLLAIEMSDSDRVWAVETEQAASATFGRFAQALQSVVRRQDILVCETETRAWIIARDTARLGAQALGERLAGAVRSADPWRGAPLALSVGIAVLGENGRDATVLMEAAEQARFAAEASGLVIVAKGAGAQADTAAAPGTEPRPEL